MTDYSALPSAEFGFPGPLCDKLVSAILTGAKTSTTGLLVDYEVEGEPLPTVGTRQVVVDSDMRPVAVIEVTEVRTVPLRDVDWPHVRDEGEGDESIASWRAAHEAFWHSSEMREALGDPHFEVDDDTIVVAERFRLVERIQGAGG
ncbi:ASCH domain-containing protein [Yinghuangia sp. YIM S09857]|uniref:ASCH domain-containing protein n=1 Tax=Yinghuangia sp. YIM S09857 TaxID=3436929 RepID=UPI003F535EC9